MTGGDGLQWVKDWDASSSQHSIPFLSESIAVHREWGSRFIRHARQSGMLATVIRLMQRIQGQKLRPGDVPWEQYNNVISLLLYGLGMVGEAIEWNSERQDILDPRDEALMIAALMSKAVPFLWMDDVRLAAIKGSGELPNFTVSASQFPYPLMYWTWQSDTVNNDADPSLIGTCQLVYTPPEEQGPGPAVVAMGLRGGRPVVWTTRVADYGARYPECLGASTGPCISRGSESLFKMLAFAQSPYLVVDHVSMPRGPRREFTRLSKEVPPPVTVVTLRSRHPNTVKQADGEALPIEWSYRWLVRGHFRNQWYPGKKNHRLIWIAPYVKGPEDKPFKQQIYAVAR